MGKQKDGLNQKTSNDLVNVRDIPGKYIHRKDDYILTGIRLHAINIDLMADSEKAIMKNNLTAAFKGEKEGFSIISIPRTVDMEAYLSNLNTRYEEEITNPYRKKVLSIMIQEATKKIMEGSNFEHHFFLMIWGMVENENVSQAEKKLNERIQEFINRYSDGKNPCTRLEQQDLIKLCNLFANSSTALFDIYDENSQYTPIPWLKGYKDEN